MLRDTVRLHQLLRRKRLEGKLHQFEGRKRVYLPDFVVALVRTPFLSPRFAQFRVPLSFNKFDMKDYLRHAYGVQVIKLRSFVQQKPITRITRDGRNLGPWRRPKSEKRITVELEEPFVWPEEPKDLSKWEKESWDASERYQQSMHKQSRQKNHAAEEPDEDLRKAYEEQAKELKENKEQWRPTWQAIGLDFARKQFAKSRTTGSPRPR